MQTKNIAVYSVVAAIALLAGCRHNAVDKKRSNRRSTAIIAAARSACGTVPLSCPPRPTPTTTPKPNDLTRSLTLA